MQLHHLEYILKSLWDAKGISKRVSILFKGPGWSPGTPRLGNPEDIPEVSRDELQCTCQGWGQLQRHDYDYNYTMITKNDYDYDYSQRKLITITIIITNP